MPKIKHPNGETFHLSKAHAENLIRIDKARKNPVGYKIVESKKKASEVDGDSK